MRADVLIDELYQQRRGWRCDGDWGSQRRRRRRTAYRGQKEEEEMEQWQRTGATRGRGSLSVPEIKISPRLFRPCSILIPRLLPLPSNPELLPLQHSLKFPSSPACQQRWEVTKDIYSRTVLKCNIMGLVLQLRLSVASAVSPFYSVCFLPHELTRSWSYQIKI